MDAEGRLYADLNSLGIAHEVVEHEAVFTVGQSEQLHATIPGKHIKNLFLKDAGGDFWLVTVPAQARVALKALPDAIGCKRVSFGSAEDMMRLIGVTPGSVTPVAAINDTTQDVRIVLDSALASDGRVNVHPLRNTATMGIEALDLIRLLRHWHHEPVIVAIPVLEPA